MLQTEFITVHNPEARGNILHEIIQVFLHLPGIIYVKKHVTGPHSGQDLSELFYELNVHMSTFFLPQINIAQMAKKLDIYTQRMKTHKHSFSKTACLNSHCPHSENKSGWGILKHT